MLKVIFKVERLVLKLNNIKCQIIAKKDPHIIQLSPSITITNGQVAIGSETQFLIIQNDPLFLIQVTLDYQGAKKLGGELSLNVAEWDENVHHSTVAGLKKSPDRNSQICYTFLYIRKDYLASEKSLILCSEYRDKNIAEMETQQRELTRRQNRLEDQIKKLKEENLIMHTSEQLRKEEITTKKRQHDQKLKTYQQTIQENNIKNINLKKKNEEMVKMIQLYGKQETKNELLKKYPQKTTKEREELNLNYVDQEYGMEEGVQTKTKYKDLLRKNSIECSIRIERCQRERSRQRKPLRNFKDDDDH